MIQKLQIAGGMACPWQLKIETYDYYILSLYY